MKPLLVSIVGGFLLVGCGGSSPTGLESHAGTYTLILNNPLNGKVFAETDYVLNADLTFTTKNISGGGKIVGNWSLVGQELVLEGKDLEDNTQAGIKIDIKTLKLTSLTSGGEEWISIIKEKYGIKEIILKRS